MAKIRPWIVLTVNLLANTKVITVLYLPAQSSSAITPKTMKAIQSSKIIVTGLFAAALLFAQLTAQAVIVGPYTADANTLHLWHMDVSATPVPDAVATGGTNLITLRNGAGLGTNSYPGFGTALSTVDGGQSATTGQSTKDAYLTASISTPSDNVSTTLADPTTAAFTFEALVWIGFDPAKNFSARTTTCEIMTGESNTGANRVFQWRISPIQTDGANSVVNIVFANVNLGSSQPMIAPIPTTGTDAILSNNWYHVAVAYNGVPNTASNITFYWTLLDPSRTNANAIAWFTMTNNLPVAPTVLAIGNIPGRTTNANFLGYIDEVRISKVARGSNEMMFSQSPPIITSQPSDQTVGVGQNAGFSVTASGGPLVYQWRLYGTNLSGATQSAYSLASAQFTDAGPYDVVLTNNYGAVTSMVATLTVRTPLNLTWLGLASANWNTNDVDWVTDTSVNVAYTPGDNVTFDINGIGVPSVNLTGPLTPSAVVVSSASDYTLSSSVGGGIGGSTGLTKSGAGKLVLDSTSTYAGPTLIQNGIVQLGAGDSTGSFGTGPVTNNAAIVVNRTGTVSITNTLAGTGSLTNQLAGGIVTIAGLNTMSGPIVLNAGTLNLVGPQSAASSTNITLNAPVAGGSTVLNLSGGITLGSNVTLSLLGTTDVPDARCNLGTGNDATTNVVNGPIVVGGAGTSGTIQFITVINSELDINGSISQPDYAGRLNLRGTGVGHIYGTINLPSANHISTTDGGTWIIHSTGNSWTNSNFAGGTLRLAANNALPPGLILSLQSTLDLAGFSQQVGGLMSTAGTGIIGNSSTTSDSVLTLATADSWTFGGVIKDVVGSGTHKVGLTLAGGTLTLTNVSTYTGETLINAGTLALSGSGSLNSTAGSISIAAGATFDVSGVTSPPYAVRTGKTLSGGGVSGGATINGALNENDGGFLALIYVFGTPAINVTGGEFTLNGCDTTVTVSGGALGVGSYKLISAGTGGSVGGTLPASVTVAGSGLAANTTASLRLTSGELWLDVASTVVPQPIITSFSFDGTSLVFSGTNGIAGNTYHVLASTNVTAPLANWEPVFTNTFDVNGAFSVTNAVSPAIPALFYLLQLP